MSLSPAAWTGTPAEWHRVNAIDYLVQADDYCSDEPGGAYCVAVAQVHATLAVACATSPELGAGQPFYG